MESAEQASNAIDGQSEVLDRLLGIAEGSPEIRSDRSFKKLMAELTRCEEKIALARSFYNDSVEAMNRRAQSFPDRLIAPLAKVTNTEPLNYREFGEKPVLSSPEVAVS